MSNFAKLVISTVAFLSIGLMLLGAGAEAVGQKDQKSKDGPKKVDPAKKKEEPAKDPPNRKMFDLKHRHILQIDGVNVAGVHTIAGLDQLIAQHNAADGRKIQQAGNMVITRDWSNTREWSTWRKKVLDGKTDRRSVSIIFHDDSGAEVGRMNFYNCWPTKHVLPSLDAKNSGHATEEIHLSWETHEIKV